MTLARTLAGLILLAAAGDGHAPPTPVPEGLLRVRGALLVDDAGQQILLRGAHMPGLHVAQPAAADLQAIDAMNRVTFGIMRQRWNMNAVRLPVGVAIWRRDGQSYLDRVGRIVRTAQDAGLVVVLAAVEDSTSGAAIDTGLPSPEVVSFWKVWATFFKDDPKVIFDVFHQPSPRNVPGRVAGQRLALEWQFWLRGGQATNGQRVVGMQDLVDAIRATGAPQVIAVASFHDPLGFRGFGPDFYVRDPHILYEVQPYFDQALTDAERDANFGFLAGRLPLYAGEWGLTLLEDQPSCRSFPRDLTRANEILFQTLSYFETRGISWTAFAFQPQRLIEDFTSYAATRLDRLWTCGQPLSPQPGMGEYVLIWLTGDLLGFGTLSPDLVASAAGGPAGPVAPGEIISIHGFQIGPDPEVLGRLDPSGLLGTSLGDTRVLFDGTPAPLFSTSPYRINVQVPYAVAGKTTTTVQAFYRDIPSNAVKLQVVEAAPEIFTSVVGAAALALNQDGSQNLAGSPAEVGSVVVLYATGAGELLPSGVTGKPAEPPYGRPALPVLLTIEGTPAEILYAGEAPGFIGLLQINARVPAPAIPPAVRTTRSVPVVLRVGSQSGRNRSLLWVR